MPKVSICIPTYNQIDFLKKNLDSIIVQSYADYEIIITDDTPGNIVKNFVSNYVSFFGNKLKYFKNSTKLGSPENWNEAIRKSSGEFIKMLHHDDLFSDSDSLYKFVLLLENNPKTDFAFSATFVNTNEQLHQISLQDAGLLKKNPLLLIFNNLIGAPSTTIFRKSLNLFFDKNLKWLVDIEFYIRVLDKSPLKFIYSPGTLITTCSGASHQVTNECIDNKDVQVFEYLYLLEKIYNQKNLYKPAELKKCLLYAINICITYKIKNIENIRSCGYHGRLPPAIKRYLSINAFSAILGKIYLKFLRKS